MRQRVPQAAQQAVRRRLSNSLGVTVKLVQANAWQTLAASWCQVGSCCSSGLPVVQAEVPSLVVAVADCESFGLAQLNSSLEPWFVGCDE
jgi:hypothetical protein